MMKQDASVGQQNVDSQNMDPDLLNADPENVDPQNAAPHPRTFFGHSESPELTSEHMSQQGLRQRPIFTRHASVKCVEPPIALNIQNAFGAMSGHEQYVTTMFFKRILQAGILVHVERAEEMFHDIFHELQVQNMTDALFVGYMQKVSIWIIGIYSSNNISVQDAHERVSEVYARRSRCPREEQGLVPRIMGI